MTITVGTDFSGIGAPEQALKELGIEHEVLFACEKDKYARETYLANHSAKIMYEDITTRDSKDAPYVDLYFFGFPCQSFSIAGKRQGFEEVRGTLFFNAAEYIKEKRPKVFIVENVKGLLSHDKPKNSKSKHGRTFSTIINLLAKTVNGQILMPMYEDNLGYNVYYAVLNSKYYDVPQNRERVFIVGFRDGATFGFPTSNKVTKKLADILEPVVDEKYYLSDTMINSLSTNGNDFEGRFEPKTGKDMGNCLTARYYKMGRTDNYIEEPVCAAMRGRGELGNTNQQLEERTDGITNTITSVQKDNLIIVKEATRKGYTVAEDGDSINLSNPESKTRRGRVGDKIANTLDTACNQAVVVPDVIQLNTNSEFGESPSQQNRVYDINGQSPTLDTRNDQKNVLVPNAILEKDISNAIRTGGRGSLDKHQWDLVPHKNRIRRLTPLECMRLQGFPDTFITPCSDTQTYKMAGNSITVTVLKAIFKKIYP